MKQRAPAVETPDPSPAGGIVGLENAGPEFDWYRNAVVRALYTRWRQPMLAGIRNPVEVGVAFEILSDGSTRNIRVEQPSGISSVDRSAVRAVTEATIPPLPKNWRSTSERAFFVFKLFPDDLEP